MRDSDFISIDEMRNSDFTSIDSTNMLLTAIKDNWQEANET